MPRSADDEALIGLARTVTGISTRAADRLGALSVVQLRALTVVAQLGPANLGQLAQELGVTVSTASRLVDRLVRAGYVDRRPSPHSRREVALTLTTSGTAMLDEYDELRLQELRTRGVIASATPYQRSYLRLGPSIATSPDQVDQAITALQEIVES